MDQEERMLMGAHTQALLNHAAQLEANTAALNAQAEAANKLATATDALLTHYKPGGVGDHQVRRYLQELKLVAEQMNNAANKMQDAAYRR